LFGDGYPNAAFDGKVARVLPVESNGYDMSLLYIMPVGGPGFSASVATIGAFYLYLDYDFMKKLA
jgi:hypothetical protein